jgi:hypothetical protein
VKLLPQRGMLVRAYEADAANVRAITVMIELFPFDLLLIATHCGDAPGFRWTYEFTDTESIARTLIVDIAVGFGATDDRDMAAVTQFMHFVSLDGVDWRDPAAKHQHYIGSAMNDFMARGVAAQVSQLRCTHATAVKASSPTPTPPAACPLNCLCAAPFLSISPFDEPA